MPNMVLHRNHVLRTTKGRTVRFIKDEPTHVPSMLVPDAVSIGATPVEGTVDVIGDAPAVVHMAPAEREAKILEAIKVMIERNERGDFTGSGMPDARKMSPITGFSVDSSERDKVWRAYQQDLVDDSE